MTTDQNNTGDRLAASELEQLRARVEYLEARLTKIGEERDALAAHQADLVRELTACQSVLHSLAHVGEVTPEYAADAKKVLERTKEASLARRDAEKRIEGAMAIRHLTQGDDWEDDDLRAVIDDYVAVAELRRQAEIAGVLDRMGSGAEALVREIEGTQDKGPRS